MTEKFIKLLAPFVLVLVALFAVSAKLNQVQAQQNYGYKELKFTAITTTTRSCASFPLSDIAYVQVFADVTLVNTTTVSTQYTNNNVNYTVGTNLVTDIVTDTALIASGNVFTLPLQAVSLCINVATANSNPITVTAIAYAPLRD
jgi:hypothetical protein